MSLVSSALVRYEDLRALPFGAIAAFYTAVGLPFFNPVRILKVTNLTDIALLISFNGVDDMDVVAANGAYVYDFSTNRSSKGGLLEQPANDRLYVKQAGAAPATSGNIYVTVIYASQV